jgi:hypothetical protein
VTTPLPAIHLHSSMALNGKLSIVEDDTRTMFDTSSGYKWCFNLSCTMAMIRRNAFTAGLSNRGIYNFDLEGAGWLGKNRSAAERGNTSEIWSTVQGVVDALKKADPLATEGPLALPQVAVFFDERAPIVQPLGGYSQGAWSIDGMSQSLTRTGAGGQRYYYTDDLLKVASDGALREGIKLAIFPNFFTGSPAVRAALAAWQGDAVVNTTFVFYGPAGIVQSEVRDPHTPCTTDVTAVTKVTGIPELIEHTGNHTSSQVQMKATFTAAEKAAFPLIEALQTASFGSSGGTFSPLLTVDTSTKLPVGVFVLGHYDGSNGPDSHGVSTVDLPKCSWSVEYPNTFLGGCVAGGVSSPGHCKAAFKTLTEAQAACASTKYPTCCGVTTRGLSSQANFSVELRSSYIPKKVPSAQRKRGVVESSYLITNTAACKASHVPLPGPPALVAKARQGGGHNIYSAANDMPSALLTTLARSAGVHIYCDGEDCGVLASGNTVWVHAIGPTDTTTRSGKRVITLPEPMLVTDEAGVQVCAEACTTFNVDLWAGESELFIIARPKATRGDDGLLPPPPPPPPNGCEEERPGQVRSC